VGETGKLAVILAAALLLPAAWRPPAIAGPASGAEGPASDNVVWDLDQVVRIALDRHPQVSQADADTRAAAARKGQAQSAYYPSIDLSAGYSRSRSFSTSQERNLTTTTEFLQGSLSQVLTDFGRTGAAVARADALLSSSRETGRAVRDEVAFVAKVGYYNVLRAQRIFSVSQETVRQRESLLRQAKAYYDAGIRARIDVARAEANLYQARAELTSAENDLRVARITLLSRMGIDGPRDFGLRDTLAAESLPGTLDEWIREAEAGRPELRALLEEERAAEMALRAARAGHNPVLTGNGEYGYAAEEMPLEQNYAFTVELSVPVFTGFLTRRQVAEARANLESARHAVTDFRRQVRLQVEQAALSVRAASERSDARRKEKEAAEENLRLASGRYEVGAGNIIEMIDAQVQMTRSDTDWIDALYDTSISVAALLRAMGR
jgi:TolC family type I secretion outer membrane protein